VYFYASLGLLTAAISLRVSLLWCLELPIENCFMDVKNWNKIGEDVVGCLTNSILLFGSQTMVLTLIKTD